MTSQEDKERRSVPRVALLTPHDSRDLLEGFPGRFVTVICRTPRELESHILASPLDLVLLDCREKVPEQPFLDLLRTEHMVEILAVGRPPERRSLPSWLLSHWCPWPVDRRIFYRLVVALARKGASERASWRQGKRMRDLEDEAELGRRVAQVLHEMGNPLDAAIRFVRLARDRSPEPKVGRWLDDALLGLARIGENLEELHGRARRASYRLGRVDLRDSVREACILSGILEDSLEVSTVFESGPQEVSEGVARILAALLVNSREAVDGAGRISIECSRVEDDVVVRISDDGEGFGELFKEELFLPWFSTKKERGGMGIGLAGARAATEQLGGSLEANSAGLGQGASFTVRLPLPKQEGSNEGDESAVS